jgi:hypothetical protein
MDAASRLRPRAHALAALLLAAAAASAQTPAVDGWREREFSFTYMGFTTTYSCEGLKGKVRTILAALGARDDLSIRATGCEIGGGVALAPQVHVRAAFPDAAADGVVTLAPRRTRGLEAGDCELVEQLRDRVLPDLGFDVRTERAGCVPHQLSLGRPYPEVAPR